jgi:putative RNA 2'-phosphotransferase
MTALLRASRFVSWALRHAPEEANITLDPHGWTLVRDLLRSLRRNGHDVTDEVLKEIVAQDAKGRFSFSDDGRLIRANYGHSVNVTPDIPASMPPDILYHGTARQNLPAIKDEGLLRLSRRFVHLTRDIENAFAVGSRHGSPVVIVVDTDAMYADGLTFYEMTGQIWLTESVPANYLKFDSLIFDAGESRPSSSDAASRAPDPLPTP